MKSITVILLLVLSFSAQSADVYTPDKLSTKVAEAHCSSLVLMSKPSTDAAQILVNVQADIIGGSADGRKIVSVVYLYNTPGAAFGCVFFDYTRGRLQLAEFGEFWPDGEKNTKAVRLY